jgi:hypothetical protein
VLTIYLTFPFFKNSLPKSPPPSYYSSGASNAPQREKEGNLPPIT